MQIIRLAPIVPVLLLAACHNRPSPTLTIVPTLTVEQPRTIGPTQGLDLPTDASDVLNELRDSRVDFVARYYRDPASRWPALSASEAQRLSSLGVRIVAVWEPLSPDPAYFSYFSGYNDAIAAYRQAKAVGQPAGSAIYFAIDFNAQALEPIEQYFRGIAAGLAVAGGGRAEYKVGIYGSGAVCDALKRAGLAQYSWLSNALEWTGSLEYNDWDIRQGDRVAGLSFNHDADDAREEYGGFRIAGPDTAAPYAGAAPRDVVVPPAPQEGQKLTTAITPLP